MFIIDFLSCIPGSFDTVTSVHKGFCSGSAAAGLGPSGLTGFAQSLKVFESLGKMG